MTQCYAIFPMLDTQKQDQGKLHAALNALLEFIKAQFSEKTLDRLDIDIVPFSQLKPSAFDALEMIGRKAWKKVESLQ